MKAIYWLLFAASFLAMVVAQANVAGTVYGQAGSFFTGSGNQGGLSASSLQTPIGIALDSSQNLYAADAANNRVLFYVKGSTTATRVYGQGGSFVSNTANNGGVTANSLSGPTDVVVDSSNGVYIADRPNHRVLYYSSGSTTATRVYGQLGSFTTNTPRNGGINANTLYNPSGLALDSSGNLYVADSSNNRVLFFSSGSTTATRVYGQFGNFNTWTSIGIDADTLNGPTDVEIDSSGNIYIADNGNSRVLYYVGVSLTATRVYGQFGSFTSGDFSNPGGVSRDTLSQPRGVVVSSSAVFIMDTGNNRVLRYPNTNTSADFVYGQPSFSTNVANNGGISASTVNLPYRVALASNGDVYLSDGGNSRILFYTPSGTTSSTSGTTSPAGSNVCFHHSTSISYKGRIINFEGLSQGQESECKVPHTVWARGLELSLKCGMSKKLTTLILTPDHLVKTDLGYVSAENLSDRHVLYNSAVNIDGGSVTCRLVSSKKRAESEIFFGLNCLESDVYANSIATSTFGRYHYIPAFWMKTVGKLFDINRASSWGDSMVNLLSHVGLY